MRHGSLVATIIEVTDEASFQSPCRTYGHLGHVVTTKETSNLELITVRFRETGVDAHLVTEAVRCQQFVAVFVEDTIDYLAGVIHKNDGAVGYRCAVTATIRVDDGSAQ